MGCSFQKKYSLIDWNTCTCKCISIFQWCTSKETRRKREEEKQNKIA